MKFGRFAGTVLLGAALLGGCQSDPYRVEAWTGSLTSSDEKVRERAITELERLCNPAAIPALGKAYEQYKDLRMVQVIIELARPLTGQEAIDKHCTDYFHPRITKEPGRKESFAPAIAELRTILSKLLGGGSVDTAAQPEIDAASKAVEAIGNFAAAGASIDSETLGVVTSVVDLQLDPKVSAQRVRLSAITALGKLKNPAVIETLGKVIRSEPDKQPVQAVGAAVNALGAIGDAAAQDLLIEAMYRWPAFFPQARRALLVTGGELATKLRSVLRGDNASINVLFKDRKLDKYCGDDGKAAPEECQEVSLMQYYAGILLGDVYSREAVDDLVAVLKAPLKPAYFANFNPGPPAHNSVLDALRKIGEPAAASAVLALWADPKTDPQLRPMAASVYSFVSVDGSEKFGNASGLALLAKTAADDKADQALRLACAESFARLASSEADIQTILGLAKKYADESAKFRAQADAEPKKKLDEANKVVAEAKAKSDETAKAIMTAAEGVQGDLSKVDPAIISAAEAAKTALNTVEKDVLAPAKQAFDQLDQRAKGYKDYQRLFESHAARIAVAVACRADAGCVQKVFAAKQADVFEQLRSAGYIGKTDAAEWTDDDKKLVFTAQVERAIVQLRRQGEGASSQIPALMQLAKTYNNNRLIRQAMLMTLPRLATAGNAEVIAGLDEVIKEGQGRQELKDLNFETELVRHFFSGGKP